MSIVVLGSIRRTWETELIYARRGHSPFTVKECLEGLQAADDLEAEGADEWDATRALAMGDA